MKKTILGSGLVLLFAASSVFAGTATGSMEVSATVIPDCVINTVEGMTFGSLGLGFTGNGSTAGVNATATSVINYTCTNTPNVAPILRLGQGLNAAATSTDAAPLRRMKFGSNYIGYALYQDESTTVWNNTTLTGVSGVANGSAQNVTVYGVATAANVPAGLYSDTVVVSIDF